MTLSRRVLITEAAYAVLTELKQGDTKWHVRRPQAGKVELELDGDVYAGLLAKLKEWNVATISDVIIEAYKRGQPGTLGGGPVK